MAMRTVRVTKLEAAIEQLCYAIAMFFHEEAPLPTYALACNAGEVLRTLCGHAGEDYILSVAEAKFGGPKNMYRRYNAAWNFLKHANRDPSAILEFNEKQVVHALWCATLDMQTLVGSLHDYPAPNVFYHWFIQSEPELAPELCELPEGRALFERADGDSGGIRYRNDGEKRAHGRAMLHRAAAGAAILSAHSG